MATQPMAGAEMGMGGGAPPAAPDVSALPAMTPQAGPNPGGAVQPSAAQPVSPHAGFFDKVLNLLSGGPKHTYQVDQTGKMQRVELPTSRKDQMMMILAGALTGLAAGSQEHGPGADAKAIGTGFQAEQGQKQQQDRAAQANAQRDYERQQQMNVEKQGSQLRAAQTFEANQRAILTSRQAEQADEASRQKYVEMASPAIEAARGVSVNGVSALKREHLTQQQLMQEHGQDGARHATSNIYLPDGLAPVTDQNGAPVMDENGHPRMEYTYAELDPHATVQLDATTLNQAVRNGYPVPGYTPGAADGGALSLPVKDAANLVHYNQGVENFRSLVGAMNGKLGLKGEQALNADRIIAGNPQLGQAFYQMAGHFDGRPSQLGAAIEGMQKDPKLAPYAQTLVRALGGDKLDSYLNKVKGEQKVEEEAPLEAVKADQQEAKEVRAEVRADERDRRKMEENQGSAINPATGRREVVSEQFAHNQSWRGFEAMKPQQIEAAKDQVRMFNVVQADHSGYMAAAQRALKNPPSTEDLKGLHDLLNKAGFYDLDAEIAAGGHVKLPVVTALGERLSRWRNSDIYRDMGTSARDLYDNYLRALSAVPAYQKALTKVGRTNKEMMDLELQNIPNPTIEPGLILQKGQLFQRNLDLAQQGMVHFEDLEDPREVKEHIEGGKAGGGAGPTPAGRGGIWNEFPAAPQGASATQP